MNYGEPNWRKKAEKCLEKMNTYDAEAREAFLRTLDWLHEHACSRTYGLGTRLPWDADWLVESLSDSTIYMAYYTIAHLLQDGVFDGSKGSPLGIKPEQCDRQFFDFVFLGKPVSSTCTVPQDHLNKMRNEFLYANRSDFRHIKLLRYWYPMDLRVSGKDLIPNHLTYSLYNHSAIFSEELCVFKYPLVDPKIILVGRVLSEQMVICS